MKLSYVIRQRRSALSAVFFLSAVAYFLYAFLSQREYTAYALVQGYAAGGVGTAGSVAAAHDDFNTNVRILESDEVAQAVAAKLSDADRGRLLAPYAHIFQMGPTPSVAQILLAGRIIAPGPSALNLDIGFRHPNAAVAATLANALAEEFLRQHDAFNADKLKNMVAALQAQADAQHKRADDIQAQMDELTQKYGVTNVDATSDTILVSAIEELNKKVIQNKAALDELTLRGEQIQQQAADKKPLWELNFIGGQPHILALEQAVQAQADQLKQVQSVGYADNAPIITDAKARVDAAMQELNEGAAAAVKQVAADLEAAQNNYNQSVERLSNMQKQTGDLAQQRAKYDALRTDLSTAQQMYSAQEVAMANTQTKAKLEAVTYSIVARAEAPPEADPQPWVKLALASLGWGLGGGVLALAGFAIFLPPPVEQHEEYERRRRRHRHFHSSSRRR
jgi:polysaccharide biosynthesis transport protein